MQILDGKNHRLYDRIAPDIIVEVLNTGRHWGWLEHQQTSDKYPPETVRRANEIFLRTFRGLVDQWIDSGIREDGAETPSRREIRGRWVDSATEEGLTGPAARKYVPAVPKGYSTELFEVLLGWLNRNLPKPALMNNGRIAILDQRPILQGSDLETYARESAIYYLKELLECPAPSRVGRCKNDACRTYYVRKRARNGAIKRGAYCGKCIGIGATERTRRSRQRRKEMQLDVAAEAWEQWKKSSAHPRQADWVAKRVNQKFPHLRNIQAKWVTQNLPEIMKRIDVRA